MRSRASSNLAAGGYDAHVLDLLGLLELEPLLPDIRGEARQAGRLCAAPAAALGLLEGTPVVLAPADRFAAALALGLDASASDIGCSLLEPLAAHLRIAREPAPVEAGDAFCTSVAPFPTGGFARAVIAPAGTLCIDWLVGICEEILVDAGLIGFPRAELINLLERKAALATNGLPSFRLVGEDASTHLADPLARARLDRLSGRASLYAVLRAIYQSIGQAAGTSHGALGGRLRELRVAGEGARSALCRGLLGACVGAPVRALHRSDAAAAGAALLAAAALGHYRDARASFGDWVLPQLGEPEPVDRSLCRSTMTGLRSAGRTSSRPARAERARAGPAAGVKRRAE
jgi:erythritol kinase (D-erythritol 1-phosphate-forming)